MHSKLQKQLAATTVALSFVLTPIVAQAQAPAPAPAQPAPTIEPTEEQLNAFVVAFLDVSEIQMVFNPQIEAAASDAQAQQLQQQAADQMFAAVQATGLTIDDYNAILNRAAGDQEFAAMLQQQIDAEIQARQGAPATPAPAP